MEVLSGYMSVTSDSDGLLANKKSHGNCWCVLYSGKGQWPPHFDLYKSNTNLSPDTLVKSIYIEQAKWQPVESTEPAFSFSVKGKRFVFVCHSRKEHEQWTNCLICLCEDLERSRRTMMTSNHNVETSRSDFVFSVVAEQREGCLSKGFVGSFKLMVDKDSLKLLDYNTENTITKWNHYSIRNYGHTARSFYAHVGTKCETGQGIFHFQTREGEKIMHQIKEQTIRLKELQAPLPHNTALRTVSSSSTSSSGLPSDMNRTFSNASHDSQSSVSNIAAVLSSKTRLAPDPPKQNGQHPNPGFPMQGNEAHGSKQGAFLQRYPSVSSAEDSKISEKERRKEEKKREKLEKKQQKEQAKKDKESKKREERERKKMAKSKVSKEAVPQEPPEIDDHTYAEAYETNREVAAKVNANPDEKIYFEPWEKKPIIPTLLEVEPEPEPEVDMNEAIYSQPVKKQTKSAAPAPKLDDEAYEDVANEVPPAIVPPAWESGQNNEAGNVYDLFSSGQASEEPSSQGNVYGIASATPIEPHPNADYDIDNVYSEVS